MKEYKIKITDCKRAWYTLFLTWHCEVLEMSKECTQGELFEVLAELRALKAPCTWRQHLHIDWQ